jgi:hypothetical protein
VVATCKRTAHPKPRDGQPQAPSTDSDELLIAVFEHVRDETTQAVLDAFANAPDDPRAKAHAAISAAWQLIFDDPKAASCSSKPPATRPFAHPDCDSEDFRRRHQTEIFARRNRLLHPSSTA